MLAPSPFKKNSADLGDLEKWTKLQWGGNPSLAPRGSAYGLLARVNEETHNLMILDKNFN